MSGRSSGTTRHGAAVLAAVISWASVAVFSVVEPAGAAPGAVSGIAFRDLDFDGVRGPTEPGVAGLDVTVTDADGTTATGVTGPGGAWSVSLGPLAAAPDAYRVEFSIPPAVAYFQPGPLPEVAAPGAVANGSTLQFVAANGTAHVGVVDPSDFCERNPDLATPCYTFGPVTGSNAAEPALVTFAHDAAAGFPPASGRDLSSVPGAHVLATFAEIGATYGLAQDPENEGGFFNAAYLKRHSGLADTPGTIFRVPPVGSAAPVTVFARLPAGADPHPANSASTQTWLRDGASYDAVGKVGLGDLDIVPDRSALVVVNLSDKRLYRVPVDDPTAFTSASIPAPADCAGSDWRPFALDIAQGSVFVGGVCTAQSTQTVDSSFAVSIFRGDLETFTFDTSPVLRFGLGYDRKCADGKPRVDTQNLGIADNGNDPTGHCAAQGPNEGDNARWQPWENTLPTSFNGKYPRKPQPLLTDIDHDDTGALVLGFRDRFGDSTGNATYPPAGTSTTLYQGAGIGDILRACRNGDTWVLESNGTCGGVAGGGVGNGEGPDGGEFFNGDDHWYHDHLGNGGLFALPGSGLVADTVLDPLPAPETVSDGGILWHDITSGSRARTLRVYDGTGGQSITAGKSNGLGDLEAWCAAAPVQIGDRVWLDTDGDGIQDAGEVGIQGVTVTIAGPAGDQVTQTDVHGRWATEIDSATAYTVTVDPATAIGLPAGITPADLELTVTDAGGSDDDTVDSDAVDVGGLHRIAVAPHAVGGNDHTFDTGYTVAPDVQRLGNRVWLDTDRNGRHDDGEPGMGGVQVVAFLDDGDDLFEPADDAEVGSTTTDDDGRYHFGDLGEGTYFVAVPGGQGVLAGLGSTPVDGVGVSTDHDDDGAPQAGYAAVSFPVPLVAAEDQPEGETAPEGDDDEDLADAAVGPHDDADSNLTVDFGFVRPHAIGNTVWFDVDDSGTFDAGETPAAGVQVDLLTAVGGFVGSTVTDGNGRYVFDDLPAGDYVVEIPAANFAPAAVLAGYRSSSAPDGGDDGVDNDDNGVPTAGPGSAVRSSVITVGTDEPTDEDPSSPTVALDGNGDLTVDFGFFIGASLGDRVWFDADGDGTQDGGEPGIGGVTVELLADDVVVDTTTTDADGDYGFGDLAPGAHTVRFVDPDGVLPTLADVGDDLLDSDPGPDGTVAVTLDPGEHDPTIDAGYRVDAGISLEKQVQDPDDPGTWRAADDLDGETAPDSSPVAHLVGGSAAYRFVVTNTGTTPLVDVTVVDADLGCTVTDAEGAGVLGAGASIVVSPDCDAAVDAAFTNTATVTGTPATDDGTPVETALGLPEGAVPDVTDGDEASVVPVQPAVELTKTPAAQTITGDQASVVFDLAVRNVSVGVVELADVTVSDALCDTLSGTGGDTDGDDRLDQDEIWTFTCTVERPADGWDPSFTNVATVTASVPPTAPDGTPLPESPDVSDGDEAEVVVADLALSKQVREAGFDVGTGSPGPYVDDEVVRAGEDVDWRVVVTNTGGVTLTEISLTDSECPSLTGPSAGLSPVDSTGDTAGDGTATLSPGESWTLECSSTDLDVDTVNTVAASATPEGDDVPLTATAAAEVDVVLPHVSVRIDVFDPFTGQWLDADPDAGTEGANSGAVAVIAAGTDVDYRVEVFNPDSGGDGSDGLTLTGVAVDVVGPEGFTATLTVDSLAPGASHLFDPFTVSGVTSPDDATAEVTAAGSTRGGEAFGPVDGADGIADTNDRDRAQITAAAIDLVKEVAPAGGAFLDADDDEDPLVVEAGTDLTYRLTVTNTGTTTLGAIGLNDALSDCDAVLVDDGDGDTVLAPGEVWAYECTIDGGFSGTVSVRNGATVSGTPIDAGGEPTGDPVGDVDEANVDTFEPASIGDRVWHDLDQDGTQDDGEPGVDGVTVELRDGSGSVVATTTTDDQGAYRFEGLEPGDYSVSVVVPDGWSVSPADQGTDDSDSDSDASGAMPVTTLDSGEDDPTWDAGIFLPASLGDFVWLDLDADGVQDEDEPGIAAVAVDLLDETGAVIDSTVTDDEGAYGFDDLPPGTYSVAFTAPSGHVPTRANTPGDDAADSDADPDTGRSDPTTLAPGEHDPTLDAGFVFPARLGDRVFYDADRDGLQGDPGDEPGVPGVTVNLLDGDGVVLDTTTTDLDGLYAFEDLLPDTYVVEVVPPAGWSITAADVGDDDTIDSDVDPLSRRTGPIAIVTGDDDLTWDAGIHRPAAIGDRVWLDLDRDGLQDEGEPGLADVTVYLRDGAGEIADATLTDGSGTYRFDDLIAGVYSIEVLVPDGYRISPRDAGDDTLDSDIDAGGRTVPTTLVPGEDDPSWDGGLYLPSALGDRVWIDTDQNGSQDDEPGVPGVTVNLLDEDGSVLDTTTTGPDGRYLFDDLTAGTYIVEFVPPVGTVLTEQDSPDAPNDEFDSDADRTSGRTVSITLDAGQVDLTWDAGIIVPAGLGNRVWEDLDADGVQDPGEPGIGGVTVTLAAPDGTVLDSIVTDDEGGYLFVELPAGDYVVVFDQPAGFEPSPAQVDDPATDSDADPVTGASDVVTLPAGATDLSVDAGFWRPASLGDTVFHDLDADGTQDPGEPGMAGVTVTLFDDDGIEVAATTTDDTGTYGFDDLAPGTYSVVFEQPDGWNPSPVDAGTDTTDSDADPTTGAAPATDLVSGEVDPTIDAGFWLPASLGDFVWLDLDGDGVQGAAEPGVAGVTVQLRSPDGRILATTVTDGDGGYLFDGLAPGTYVVDFVPPAGLELTVRDNGPEASDSDADPVTGRTAPVTLASGDAVRTVDAGLYEPAAIGGTVILDDDGDGIQDPGEQPIPGVPISLVDDDGVQVGETVTDDRGDFIFDPVPPGDYTVVLIPPTRLVPSPDNVGDDDTVDSDFDEVTNDTPISVESGETADVDGLLRERDADLVLDKVLVTDSPDGLVWEMRVTNLGPDVMPAPIIVNDPVPAAMGVRSAAGDGWECLQVGNDVTCTWLTDLAPGASLPPVRVSTDPPPAGVEASNGATVQGVVIETQGVNNSDSVRVVGVAPTDEPTGVLDVSLPRTGGEALRLALFGVWVAALGAVLTGIANQHQRRLAATRR